MSEPFARYSLNERNSPCTVEILYRDHRHWLLALLARRFGRQEAEDLAQETFAKVATTTAKILNPRAFLAHVALNAARDQARRRAVRPELVAEDAAPAPPSDASQDASLLLKQVILALPRKQREVFLLSRFAGLTYEEIACRLGISVKTVEARMTIALATCAALLR